MPNVLNAFDALEQSREVVLAGRHGRRLRLRGVLPIEPGSPLQLRREVPHDSWQPHPEWSGMDASESVMTSLSAPGACLEFHVEQKRTRASGVCSHLSDQSQ
jgi:hypothetical protein